VLGTGLFAVAGENEEERWMVASCPSRCPTAEAAQQAAAGRTEPPVGGVTGAVRLLALPGSTPVPAAGHDRRPSRFDEVLARYQDELYRFAAHLTRNRADADDLYQETLLKAYRAFGRLDGGANHRAWLYKIATNAFLSDRRKRGREGQLDGGQAEAIPAAAADQAARLDARDLLREVEAFVDGLPLKQRVALVQRKYHDLSYAEIAANLRCSEAAARANVHEALRKLRERFGDRP
jgi:RNA polymerase sigma-70 factor (ECF subfamily)